jgi:anhydro-N-acetylmuramic acid kinase
VAIENKSLQIIGLMSGTSLDGLDIAYVTFHRNDKIQFELHYCETIRYSNEWKNKLANAFYSDPEELKKLDAEYGIWLGNTVLHFIKAHQISPDLIASHGHTIFHKPKEKYTLQIGSGKMIHELTQVPVVNNFRAQDVALGGQGAPLVPIGDELLFSEYDFCLNHGGFANASWKAHGKRLACDIGVCNILLNQICQSISLEYDKDGKLASSGKVILELLNTWNEFEFYKLPPPKSLGREWYEANFLNDIQNPTYTINDLLATATEHVAIQIHKFLTKITDDLNSGNSSFNVLSTGGGAHNSYLIKKLQEYGSEKIRYVIPEKNIVDFKEAIVFALLGYLRWQNEINVLASVTGAENDHSSGEIFK